MIRRLKTFLCQNIFKRNNFFFTRAVYIMQNTSKMGLHALNRTIVQPAASRNAWGKNGSQGGKRNAQYVYTPAKP